MKYITHIFLAFIIIVGALYGESFCMGSAAIVAFFVLMFAYLKFEIEEVDYVSAIYLILSLILYGLSLVSQDVGLRAIVKVEKVKIVTTYYPIGRVLATGTQIDTLKHQPLRFEDDGHGVKIQYGDLYLLHNGDTITLLTNQSVVARGRKLSLQQRYFRWGFITTLTYYDDNGDLKVVDIENKDIRTKDYRPQILDIQPTIDCYY